MSAVLRDPSSSHILPTRSPIDRKVYVHGGTIRGHFDIISLSFTTESFEPDATPDDVTVLQTFLREELDVWSCWCAKSRHKVGEKNRIGVSHGRDVGDRAATTPVPAADTMMIAVAVAVAIPEATVAPMTRPRSPWFSVSTTHGRAGEQQHPTRGDDVVVTPVEAQAQEDYRHEQHRPWLLGQASYPLSF